MKKLLLMSLFALTFNVSAEPFTATSEMVCDDTKEVAATLKEIFEESPILFGKTADQIGSTMSIWINSAEGSWTIVATKGDLSCVIGYGTNLKVISTKKKDRL